MYIRIEKHKISTPPLKFITLALEGLIYVKGEAVDEHDRAYISSLLDSIHEGQIVSYDLDNGRVQSSGVAKIIKIDRNERSVREKVILEFDIALQKVPDKTRFVLDASAFTSPERLNDMLKMLAVVTASLGSRTETIIVIPSSLYNELMLLRSGGEFTEKLVEIFRAWLPNYSKDRVKVIVRGLMASEEYRKKLNELFDKFNPVSTENYVANLDRIGDGALHRQSLRERLGQVVGDLVFEVLAVLHKLGALVITFSERLATLAYRLGVQLMKVSSSFKEHLKTQAKIRRTLKLIGYALSLNTVSLMLDSFLKLTSLPPWFQKYLLPDAALGIILIIDG